MIDWIHFHLRESPTRQKPWIFRRKTRIPRIKLSESSVNPKWPKFETENQLPSRDTQRKLADDLQPTICNNEILKKLQIAGIPPGKQSFVVLKSLQMARNRCESKTHGLRS